METISEEIHTSVVDALRQYYFHLETIILNLENGRVDLNNLMRILDDLNEFNAIVSEVQFQSI